MIRFLKVLGLWFLFGIVGIITVSLGTWSLWVVGAKNFMGPFVAAGLAVVFPVSLVVAEKLLPGPQRGVRPFVPCPHCGGPLALDPEAKLDPGTWPLD